eukprot:CCRYP_001519-RA/>CCRYP_001519-RA protein AED:0.11 eAED:0.05 QI:0/0/0/0.85/0.83/0.85/7/0/577
MKSILVDLLAWCMAAQAHDGVVDHNALRAQSNSLGTMRHELVFGPTPFDHSRRRLSPDANIIHELNDQLNKGITHPRFTLTANFNANTNLFTKNTLFEVDVVFSIPSVSESTSVSVDGFSLHANDSMKILVADQNDGYSRDFAILVVDEEKSAVIGIIQKDKLLLKLEQVQGGQTVVSELTYDPPEMWTCDSDDLEEEDESHDHHDHQPVDIRADHYDPELTTTAMPTGIRQRNLYATNTFPNAWSYQVDLYIEVDNGMISNRDTDPVNIPNTIAYINALVTAVSSIFEKEIDTHLNVIHIAKTDIYDSAANTAEALGIMRTKYGNKNTWHYTDPSTGQKPDLHFALLYGRLGGGVAYQGGLCNPSNGYGVTSRMQGTLSDVANTMFWDIYALAHELGHSFGSGHTHNIKQYNPPVDNCGNQYQNNRSCPSLVTGDPILAGQGSIMSYCHLCKGGVSNIDATFGGYWHENDRTSLDNWNILMNLINGIIYQVMYDFVSSRACVAPYLPVRIQTCLNDSDCHDGDSCSIDQCIDSQCSNVKKVPCVATTSHATSPATVTSQTTTTTIAKAVKRVRASS